MQPAEISPSSGMLQLLAGRWVTGALGAVAELAVADELAGGPKTPEEIAVRVGADPQALHRVLRALASMGVFIEDDQGRFANSALSETLRTGPETLRASARLAGSAPIERSWEEVLHAVRTGTSAFERVHGLPLFEFGGRNPAFGALFNAAMTARSSCEVKAIVDALDFAGVDTLVDVGGGQGLLLATVLARNPSQRGILLDLPTVVAKATPILAAAGVLSRCEIVGGNFFEAVPEGADGYVIKHVLHNWDDESAIRILKTIHTAARVGSRLFVLDAVITPGNEPHHAKLLDLQMLVLTRGGRQRTRPEWEKLFSAAGFALRRVVETATSLSILEATHC